MKMGLEHLVPLSMQAVQLLLSHPGITKRSGKLFPGPGIEGVMSNNTMLFALYRLGYKGRTTTHGFRGLFSTEANENGFEGDWVERQLAHDERDEVRAAYNGAQYLPQRRKMMQWWADHLADPRAEESARREEAKKVDPEAPPTVKVTTHPSKGREAGALEEVSNQRF
jgi:integrase